MLSDRPNCSLLRPQSVYRSRAHFAGQIISQLSCLGLKSSTQPCSGWSALGSAANSGSHSTHDASTMYSLRACHRPTSRRSKEGLSPRHSLCIASRCIVWYASAQLSPVSAVLARRCLAERRTSPRHGLRLFHASVQGSRVLEMPLAQAPLTNRPSECRVGACAPPCPAPARAWPHAASSHPAP